MQSLRIVPTTSSENTSKSVIDTTSASFGVHDAMRYGLRSIATEVLPKHPLEHRLAKWEETQDNFKLNLHRRMYGIHAPVKMLMERKIILETSRSPFLPTSNIGLDVLTGKDQTIDVEDVLGDKDIGSDVIDLHAHADSMMGQRA